MRVILDTNILISMSVAKAETFKALRHLWHEGRFHVLLSDELFDEVKRTLQKPKVRKILTKPKAEQLISELELFTVPVRLEPPFPECPDPDDAFLLAMIRDGEADVLVTGDKALLELESWDSAAILSVTSFVRSSYGTT